MQLITNFDLPRPLAEAAAKKARREKRRIVVARDSEEEIRFLTVGERTRNLHDVDRLCQVNPSGVFND